MDYLGLGIFAVVATGLLYVILGDVAGKLKTGHKPAPAGPAAVSPIVDSSEHPADARTPGEIVDSIVSLADWFAKNTAATEAQLQVLDQLVPLALHRKPPVK